MFEKIWQEKYDIMKQDFDFHVYNSDQSSRFKEIDRNLLNLTLHQGQRIESEKDFESMLENMLENIKLVKMRIEEMFCNSANAQVLFPNYSEKIASELSKIDCRQKMLNEAIVKHKEDTEFSHQLVDLHVLAKLNKTM